MDIAEALTKPGVPNGAHQHMVTPRGGSSEVNSVGSIGELLESENIQTETISSVAALSALTSSTYQLRPDCFLLLLLSALLPPAPIS